MPFFKMACKGLTPKSNRKNKSPSSHPANNRTVPTVCFRRDDVSEAGSADLVGAVGGLDTSEIDAISSKYSSSSENLNKCNPGQPLEKLTAKRKAKTLTFGRKKNDKMKDTSKKAGRFWTIRKRFPVRLKIGKDHGLPEPTAPIETGSCICTEYRRTEDHVLGPGIVFAATRSSNRCGATASPLQPSSLRTTRRAMGAGPGPTGIGCLTNPHWLQQLVPAPLALGSAVIDLSHFNPDDYPTEDVDEMLIAQRARDMEMGVEVSPSHIAYPNLKYSSSTSSSSASSSSGSSTASSDHIWNLASSFHNQCVVTTTYPVMDRRSSFSREPHINDFSGFSMPASFIPRTVHTQVDYIHCLVPDLLPITNCCFYWGVMDRYEAEKLLENKPEGSFLLRDSAQEEFLFSVSFRRYGRSLHARIEQWNHRFSFDSHDPGVFASESVCGLIEHYKDPSCCMFFEPMLTKPVNRSFPFSLQHQCRATVCNLIDYDGVHYLPLPKSLKEYLRYYHYKQKVRVRRFEMHT